MEIVCLDLEGVLVPEIWIAFSEATGIPELKRTTRDEPDYDKLMNYRLDILREHGLGLKEIQETIAGIDPLPGAKEFLDELRSLTQVIIISDTFSQFAGPLMKLFTSDTEVIRHGVIYLKLISVMYILPAITNGIQGYFRGIGDLKITLLSSFINMGVRVLAAIPLVFALGMGIEALPFSYLAGWIGMLIAEIPLLVKNYRAYIKSIR